jgi:hypothetical protein
MADFCGFRGCIRLPRDLAELAAKVSAVPEDIARDGKTAPPWWLRHRLGKFSIELGGRCTFCAADIAERVFRDDPLIGLPFPCGHSTRPWEELKEGFLSLVRVLEVSPPRSDLHRGVLRVALAQFALELSGQCRACAQLNAASSSGMELPNA